MSTEPSPSPGDKIAKALRKSPVYVDPSLASAMPPAKRAELVARIKAAPMPIHIVIVPLVKGGTWDDPDQVLTVVHDRLGADGVYIGPETTARQLNGRRFGGTRQEQDDASYAVRIPFFQDEMDEATLADRLLRAVQYVAAGNGEAEYEKATAHLRRDRPSRPFSGDGGDGSALPVTAATVGVAALAGLALWRWRRTGRVRRDEGDPLVLPRATLALADRAGVDELRGQAGRELLTFGELLDVTEVDASAPRVNELLTLALDAYQAAGQVHDRAGGVQDLAGVLVLIDRGRDALASAQALAAGRKEVPPSPLCFFNPLHGDGALAVNWREIGTRTKLRVQACRVCAAALREHRAPQALSDRGKDGEPVPYYTTDTLWARTGYGQFGDDLVARLQRGERP